MRYSIFHKPSKIWFVGIVYVFLFLGWSSTVSADSGTTFTETFGDSSTSCWASGPTTCSQKWAITAGTANSIITSPGTDPTSGSANSLQMAVSGAFADIYTAGTFPTIPAGTTADVTFTIYVSSNSMTSGNVKNLITFSQATSPVIIKFNQSGTNLQLWAVGSTNNTATTISLNAWHTIVVHMASGAAQSYVQIDGGVTTNTFTVNAQPISSVQIGNTTGNIQNITYAIGNLKIDSAVGGSQPPSMFADFSGASDAQVVTTTLLNSGTHCGNGTWTGTLGTDIFTTGGATTLPSPITPCGISYLGNVGLSFRHSLSSTNIATYTFNTLTPNASVGFFWKTDIADNETVGVVNDIASISSVGTGSIFWTVVATGSSLYMRLEVIPSTLYYGTIPIQSGVVYWVTAGYEASGTMRLSVYNSTTWALIGSTTGPAQTSDLPRAFSIGKVGSTQSTGKFMFINNLIGDYNAATFPLLPDITVPTVTAFTIPTTATSLTVSISSFTATDNGTVAGYKLTESSSAPLATDSGWTSSAPTTYTFASGGAKTLYAWAKDTVGNVSTSLNAPVTITLDTTGPTGTISNGNGSPTNDTTPTLNLTIADAGVGISGAQMRFSCDNATWSSYESYATPKTNFNVRTGSGCTDSDGSKTVYVQYKDSLDNVGSSYNTGSFTLDTAASFAALSNTPTSLTNSTSATITVGGTDIVSYEYKLDSGSYGIETVIATTISLSGLADGSHTVSVIGKDSAGNWQDQGSATTYTWTVDTTAPVPTFTIPSTSNSLTVTFSAFSASDTNGATGYLVNESASTPSISDTGWAGTAQTQYVFASEGAKTLYAWAKDGAGNISSSANGSVTVTLPVVSSEPSPILSSSGGNRRPTSYSISAIEGNIFTPSVSSTHMFDHDLSYLMTDPDVIELQKYFNNHGFVLTLSGPGSPGKETDYFGLLTLKTLIKFQEAYANDILIPAGFKRGTGYFGSSTRAFLNK